jgi:hypothetical protein
MRRPRKFRGRRFFHPKRQNLRLRVPYSELPKSPRRRTLERDLPWPVGVPRDWLGIEHDIAVVAAGADRGDYAHGYGLDCRVGARR